MNAITVLNLTRRFGEFVASLTPRTLAVASAAAVLALVLQAGVITGVLLNERGGGYQTASAPATTAADGSYAMIRFAPQATAADIVDLVLGEAIARDANKPADDMSVVVLTLPEHQQTTLVRRMGAEVPLP